MKEFEDYEELTPEQLFNIHFIANRVVGDDWLRIRIDSIHQPLLSAKGTVLSDGNGFKKDEKVKFVHVDNEVWRVTSKKNQFGHAVFLGEEYGGFSIGS